MDRNQILDDVLSFAEQKLSPKQFIRGKSSIPVTYPDIRPDDVESIVNTVLDIWWTEDKQVKKFERGLCGYTGFNHATLVNSGSSANLIAMLAATKNTKGKFVITCATGFPTTVSPIYQNGKIPAYVDINPHTLEPDYEQISYIMEHYGQEVDACIIAHTLGFPYDEELVREVIGKDIPFIVDGCFVSGTKIKVLGGEKNIENITTSDLVLTRNGYKKVLWSGKTGKKQVISRIGLTATPDHPIITKRGVIRLDTLSASDIIYVWNEKKSSIEEKHIIEIQNHRKGIFGFISGLEEIIGFLYTGKYGLITLERYLKDILSITLMEILLITQSKICSVFHQKNTIVNMILQRLKKSTTEILKLPEKRRLFGMEVLKESLFINNSENNLGIEN